LNPISAMPNFIATLFRLRGACAAVSRSDKGRSECPASKVRYALQHPSARTLEAKGHSQLINF
jgi:hypothetical protein